MSDLPLPFETERPLAPLTTFGIGGPARLFVEARTPEDMQCVLPFCIKEKLPYFVLGKGSNVLFDDRGFDGVIIHNRIDFCDSDGQGHYHVGSGHSFSLLGIQTARDGWGGLEFAAGIPGTVGGALFMNAGAGKASVSNTLESADLIDEQGVRHRYPKDKLQFGYRYSSFQELKGAVVSACFHLSPSSEARQQQRELLDRRRRSQPYSEASAGCVFRNPAGQHAGALIEKAGLKGAHVGDAAVSECHANFVINRGHATARDISELIARIQTTVKQHTGVDLELEVRIIPFHPHVS